MRKNIEKVANAFVAGRAVVGSPDLRTDGITVWSYDMPIAQWTARWGTAYDTAEIVKTGPTATTRAHISGLVSALDQQQQSYFQVDCLTGRKPHVFRDLAGVDGRMSRARALKGSK